MWQQFRARHIEKPQYALLLAAILHRHKGALIEWHDIMLLGQPRRYKHGANASQFSFYVHCLACFHYTTLCIRGESAELVVCVTLHH